MRVERKDSGYDNYIEALETGTLVGVAVIELNFFRNALFHMRLRVAAEFGALCCVHALTFAAAYRSALLGCIAVLLTFFIGDDSYHVLADFAG